jgi:hypothetical protein
VAEIAMAADVIKIQIIAIPALASFENSGICKNHVKSHVQKLLRIKNVIWDIIKYIAGYLIFFIVNPPSLIYNLL